MQRKCFLSCAHVNYIPLFMAVESREQITTLLTDLGCSQADVSSKHTDILCIVYVYVIMYYTALLFVLLPMKVYVIIQHCAMKMCLYSLNKCIVIPTDRKEFS